MNRYANYITNVSGFPKPGIQFKDITTFLETRDLLQDACHEMEEFFYKSDIDKIVCADARGFIFGAGISALTGIPLVLVRKPGKLPRPGLSVEYELEYGTNILEVSAGSIRHGDRCLIVDDLLATGGSAQAMEKLIVQSGGTVSLCIVLIELMDLEGRHKLCCNVKSLVKYGIGKREKIVADLDGLIDDDQLRYAGTSELKVNRIMDNGVLCEWKLEDQVNVMLIPKNRIKGIIDVDGVYREYLE